MAKVVFLLAVFSALAFANGSVVRVPRDTSEDANKSIDEFVDSVKTGLDKFINNVKNSDLVKDFGDAAQKLGEQIQTQGKDLISKIQSSASTVSSNA